MDGSDSGGGDEPKLSNAAMGKIVDESDEKGGTLKFGLAGEWGDTVDPGETYYGYSWDMLRNYARTLVMFKTEPGKAGLELTPDLATDLGKSSDGGKTWTYTLQKGLKYEDGSEITTTDVKYAVLRSTDKKTFPNGSAYFEDMLDLPEGLRRPLPEQGHEHRLGDRDAGRQVHDRLPPQAAVRRLRLPRPAARRRPPCRRPRTPARSTRPTSISSGPYMFDGNFNPTTGFTLKRNPNWDPATDPNRKALPDEMTVKLNMAADDVDNQIVGGHARRGHRGHRRAAGGADQGAAGQGRSRRRADNPTIARALVHLDQPDGEAAGQHRLPQGDHVRDEPDVLPERLRRQVRRRRHRHHGDAPA